MKIIVPALIVLLVGAQSLSSFAQEIQVQLTIHADTPGATINRNIYGQFTEHLGRCVYEGIWVGPDSSIPNTRGIRNDVAAALKAASIPLVRWPGGCFADEYHWMDGVGPREKRPSMINTHWGGVKEDNSFGTHEFLDFCEQIGAEPYICGNVGSGTVQEMMQWVEYITSDADSPMANLRRKNGREQPWKLKYFGVGNESWGCGGNMRPEYYADEFRRYNTFVKNYGENKIYRIACGANAFDYNWTDKVMSIAGRQMNGLSLHYYTVPTGVWAKKGPSTGFGEKEWHETLHQTLRMEELLTKQVAIMDVYDPQKRVGLCIDEWGTWYDPEPGMNPAFLWQHNTLRDALVAAVNLNIFHEHADRVVMGNIAQLANVLQSLILTDKEKMILTPTYHVFEMYKVHQDATYVPVELKAPDYKIGDEAIPSIHASASRDKAGKLHLSLVNLDAQHSAQVSAKISGAKASNVTGRVLTAGAIDARNTFEQPDVVKPAGFSSFEVKGDQITINLPAKSVVVLEMQ
jgi:alpha-N-arabinofuranosidase